MSIEDLLSKTAELARAGTPFVVATVIKAAGSTPRGAGAKMVVMPDGSIVGTVGGGTLEREVIADSLTALAEGDSRLREYRLRQPKPGAAEGEGVTLGMLCGGDVEVFIEVFGRAQDLLVVGAGHIAQKLCVLAKTLDFRVTVLDERADMVSAERFPQADRLICGPPGGVAGLVPVSAATYVVIVTHGHVHDKAALASVLSSPAAYIGMIGSKNKVRTVLAQLQAEGVEPEILARVHAPIGLDLGGQKPAEIALSILAEVVAAQYGCTGGPLKAVQSADQGERT